MSEKHHPEWAIRSISEITSNIIDYRGRTPKKLGLSWGGGDIPVLSAGNVKMGYIDFKEEAYSGSETLYRRWMTNGHAKKNDIVVTLEAPLGNVALIPDDRKYILSQRTILLQVNLDQCSSKFLFHLMTSKNFQDLLLENSSGTTATGIQRKKFEKIQVAIPPLKEQYAIEIYLNDVTALICSLDRLIAKKRDIKQSVLQQLLTGQKRLSGFYENWKIVTLSEVVDRLDRWGITGGPFGSNLKASDYVNEGVRIIQLQNIGDGVFRDDYAIYTSEQKANELLSCNIYPGEIILSKMGDPVARACFIPDTDRRYLMSSDGIRLPVDKKRFDPRFVHDYINYPIFRKAASENSTGSTRQRISLGDLKKLPFVEPPLEEQKAISSILSDMTVELSALEKQRDKTLALKQGMLQELLTGRKRLL